MARRKKKGHTSKKDRAKKYEDLIKFMRERPQTARELGERIGRSPRWVREQCHRLRNDHFNVDITQSEKSGERSYYMPSRPVGGEPTIISHWTNDVEEWVVGCASDTHFGSRHHHGEGMRRLYDRFADEDVQFVLHSGDVLDGQGIYKGHEGEVSSWSLEDQLGEAEEFFKQYPDLVTKAISGNHDYSFTKRTGIQPLKLLDDRLDNFEFLGECKADLIMGGARYRLVHGAGGNAYAKSYSAQKYLRNVASAGVEEVPDLLQIGHYHIAMVFQTLGCHIVHPASMQLPHSEYCVRKGLTGPTGGYVLRFQTQAGKVRELESTFIDVGNCWPPRAK